MGRFIGFDGWCLCCSFDVFSFGVVLSKEIFCCGWESDFVDGWVMGNWINLVGEWIVVYIKFECIKDKVVYIFCDVFVWVIEL